MTPAAVTALEERLIQTFVQGVGAPATGTSLMALEDPDRTLR